MSDLDFKNHNFREAKLYLDEAAIREAIVEGLRRKHGIPANKAISFTIEFRFEDVNGRTALHGAAVRIVEDMSWKNELMVVEKPLPSISKSVPPKSARRK